MYAQNSELAAMYDNRDEVDPCSQMNKFMAQPSVLDGVYNPRISDL